MGGSSDTTTTQKTEPWGPSQPYLKNVLGGAEQLYRGDVGPQYYPGATTVPFTSQTMAGLGQMENIAGQGNPLAQAAYGQAQAMIGQGGMTEEMRAALDPARRVSSGALGLGTEGDYRGLYGQIGAGGAAQDYLTATARGDYLSQPNPALAARMQAESQRIADQTARSLGGTGRALSGAGSERIARALGDYSNQVLSEDYARERGLQQQAAMGLESAQQNRLAQMNSILGSITGLQGTNIANQLAGGQQLFTGLDTGQTQAMRWGALAPQLSAERYSDAQRMLGVGATYENKLGEELTSDIARYEAAQARPWEQLARYSGILQGIGGMGKTNLSTTPGKSGLTAGLGGALSGASLGAGIGSAIPGIGTGIGALVGGGAGLLGGIFG